jgi:hypothetical protein
MTSGELDFNNFSQRNSAPGAAMPAVSNTDQNQIRVISSLEEMRAAVEAVAGSAQRLMSIYTPDLEPDLYDQNGFLEIIKRFVLARRFAKVRVLLSDSGRLLRDNNRFIAMGRRLTSCIDIRPATGDARQRACAYLIADDRAIVYRVHPDRWDGVADLDNPPIARQYLDEFDEIWHASSPDALSRQAIR